MIPDTLYLLMVSLSFSVSLQFPPNQLHIKSTINPGKNSGTGRQMQEKQREIFRNKNSGMGFAQKALIKRERRITRNLNRE